MPTLEPTICELCCRDCCDEFYICDICDKTYCPGCCDWVIVGQTAVPVAKGRKETILVSRKQCMCKECRV